ncbi:MAG: uroporphyrinogen decarboxylase family protein [Candidatus Eisenbacteria bacterium]|uniref:Uroporphyrinogen decarboxylase family protein n=1 Tax=Eiseniibacteriota bacterium TaxID=2212470 RepID=A0A956NHY6_UNCEI|nr:uroporphyrinogen decarboxylase family protein [Candidatus Eisenbacteria bacterium]MCB9465136.1 uroporphyrinogen decarboxylase family protein [Candidatus Eisenbacteria bacterium]
MNSLERILEAVHMRPIDPAPVAPVLLQQGARLLGMPLTEYFGDPSHAFEGQCRVVERFDPDAVFAIPHVVQDVLGWGSTLTFHPDGAPSVGGMVIKRYEEIPNLPIPDPTAHPYLAKTLRNAERLAKTYGGEKLVVGAVIGPFSLHSLLMGMGKSIGLLVEHEEARRQFYPILMERMMDYTVRWAQAQLSAGCHVVVVAEGVASATLLREKTFVQDAVPVIREFVRRVDGLVALELVGDASPFLKHLADLPVAVFLIGSQDPPGEARRSIGNQALMGNLNNLKLIHWGPERVEFEARRVLAEAGPGFILSNQGPEVPWAVPDENIEALIRAARSRAQTRAA